VLEGLGTVCRYLASLCTGALAGTLSGATPEDEAAIAEWMNRAGVEYAHGASDAVSEVALANLDAHLLTRSTLAGAGAGITLADLVVYGAVHAAVAALAPERRSALCNVARWVAHVGGAAGGNAIFGEIAMVHADIPDLAVAALAAAAPSAKASKDGAKDGAKDGGKGSGDKKGGAAADGAVKGGGNGENKGAATDNDKKKEGGGEFLYPILHTTNRKPYILNHEPSTLSTKP
jgi:hypothetical protein